MENESGGEAQKMTHLEEQLQITKKELTELRETIGSLKNKIEPILTDENPSTPDDTAKMVETNLAPRAAQVRSINGEIHDCYRMIEDIISRAEC